MQQLSHQQEELMEAAPVLEQPLEPAGVTAMQEDLSRSFLGYQDEKALALLEERAGKSRPSMRKGVFQAMALVFLPIAVFGIAIGVAEGQWAFVAAMLGLIASALVCWKAVLTDDVKEAGFWASKSGDIRAVGPLADMLSWPDPKYWTAAARGLIRLLPQLKASDAALLNVSQRQAIYEKMTMKNARNFSNFLEAALTALDQIGDADSIPAVERLAQAKARNDTEKRIVERAAECLEALKARLERGDIPHQLLRPASSAAEPDQLLRSATQAGDTEPERLLRVSQPTD